VPRKRISLTLRLDDQHDTQPKGDRSQGDRSQGGGRPKGQRRPEPAPSGAMADALRRAGLTR